MATLIGSGSTTLATYIPDLGDTANIQTALKQLYYGTTGGTLSQTVGIYGALYTLFTGDPTLAGNVTISGNLTVNGTTTNLNSTNLVIEDKNIILADVVTPTNTTANGAGLTVSNGATNPTWIYDYNSGINSAWESNINISSISKLFVGPTAQTQTAVSTNPSGIFQGAGGTYAQVAMINTTSTGSSDFAAYGDTGTDTSGWVDMGFTGSGFNDSAYTITGKNDGYIFALGVDAAGNTGNLVLATGAKGTNLTSDIVFATNGFLAANEKMRLTNAGNLSFRSAASILTAASISAVTPALSIKTGDVTTVANTGAGTLTIDTGARTGTGTNTLNLGNTNATVIALGNANTTTTALGVFKVGTSTLTAGSAFGYTLPTVSSNDTLVSLTSTATLTNKTLTSPVISTITNTGTLTLPATTGTLALTNQSFFIGTQPIAINQSTGTITSLPGVSSINGATVPSSGILATTAIAGGGTGATTAPAAMANFMGYTSTATAAGTTTLTNTSSYYQQFTGSTTQTVVLPVTTTLITGWTFHIVNNSTGNLTVNSNGAQTAIIVLPGTTAMVTCISVAGSGLSSEWESGLTDFSTYTGTGNVVMATSPVITPAAPSGTTTGTVTNSASTAGYIGMPQNSKSASYTLVASDAGKHIYVTTTGQTITIPANSSVAFEIGTAITVINAASISTSIAITTDTLLLANAGTTGTRTLAAHGVATLIKITATSWIASGNGLT